MKNMQNRLGILFLILCFPMIVFAEVNATNIDTNSTDINSSIVVDTNMTDVNTTDMNVTDINITLVDSIQMIKSKIHTLIALAQHCNMNTDINETLPLLDNNISDMNETLPMDANLCVMPHEEFDMELMNLKNLLITLQNDMNISHQEANQSLLVTMPIPTNEALIIIDEIQKIVKIHHDMNISEHNMSDNNLSNIMVIGKLEILNELFFGTLISQHTLNHIPIEDQDVIMAIMDTVQAIDTIRKNLQNLAMPMDNNLSHSYDMLLHDLDGVLSKVDAVMSVIDGLMLSEEERELLKDEAMIIKEAITMLKEEIDTLKVAENNSQEAIESIHHSLAEIVGMFVHSELAMIEIMPMIQESHSIDIPKGRSVISARIDVNKLNSDIYAVWIVDGGNWYGYSPDEEVNANIAKSYRLIKDIIPPYKAVIVWAKEDTNMTVESDETIPNVTQYYGSNFSIHGTNNTDLSVDDVTCANEKGLSAIFKVHADEASVYVPEREIEEVENFTYIYHHEGYYVLCETVLGETNE